MSTASTLAFDRRADDRIRRDAVVAARDVTSFGRALVESADPRSAIAAAVAFGSDQLQTPAAGWIVDPGAVSASLIAAQRVTATQERALAAPMAVRRAGARSPSAVDVALARFSEATGERHTEPIDAGAAVIVLADPSDDGRIAIDAVRSLLPPVIRLAEQVRLAERRRTHLDTALMCVAHELRGPLLASASSIEDVLGRGAPETDLDLLRWSHTELRELAETIDLLLRWTVAGSMPRRRRTDLVQIVHRAVGSVTHETGEARVRIRGSEPVPVLVVAAALRAAIANIVRNALAYSSARSAVDVIVQRRDRSACVQVTDRGRGISESERDAIFEPFIRGEHGRGSGDGHGLGLFIARRVVQAHGGEIVVEPRCDGVTFTIEVPIA